MDISESVSMAVKTLSANRMRSLLTVLGIIIGNAAVIAVIGVGQGTQRYTTQQLQALGTNLLFISGGRGDARRNSALPNRLTLQDAEAIVRQIPSVKDVAPQINSQQLVGYGKNLTRTDLTGTTLSFTSVRNFPVDQGRFFSPAEMEGNSPVAVLGSQIANDLFAGRSPVGETVQINNLSFQVIGVMTSKGASGSGNQDATIFIPITTAAALAGRTSPYGTLVNFIAVSAQDETSVDIAEYQIGNLLRIRHNLTAGVDDFTIRNQKDVLETANNVTGALTILLGATAAISLIVGGIGIMNIMLASVTERTQEIGLRKALGASRGDILQQFLIEAIMLSVAGGVIGTILGTGAVLIIGISTPLQVGISGGAIVLAVGVSGGIGLGFGVVPAQRAAGLDPIVALRNL